MVTGTTDLKKGVLKADAMTQTAQVIYVPKNDFYGDDRFVFKACDCAYDSARLSEDAAVEILVLAVNDAPITEPISVEFECLPDTPDYITLQSSDVDTRNGNLTYWIQTLPDGASLYDVTTGVLINLAMLPVSLSGTDVRVLANYSIGTQPSSFTFDFFATDNDGATSASIAQVTVTCLARCAPGMYFHLGERTCIDCPAGTFASEIAVRSTCDECAVGKFTSTEGSTTCGSCAYGQIALTPGNTACDLCPAGATCDDASTITLNAGMWWKRTGTLDIYECPFGARSCIGGNTTNLCARGYSGILCGVCEPGYFLAARQTCEPCGEARSWVRSLVYAVAMLACIAGLGTAAIKCGAIAIGGKYYPIVKVKAKWLLDATQVVSQFSYISETTGSRHTLPEPTTSFVQLLSLSNVEILSFLPVECSIPDSSFYTTLLFKTTVLPLAPIAMVWMYFMIRTGMARHKNGNSPSETTFCAATKRSAKLSLYWIGFTLPTISTTIAQALSCSQIDDQYFLRVDYSLRCDGSNRRKLWKFYALCAATLYPIGLPLAVFLLLYSRSARVRVYSLYYPRTSPCCPSPPRLHSSILYASSPGSGADGRGGTAVFPRGPLDRRRLADGDQTRRGIRRVATCDQVCARNEGSEGVRSRSAVTSNRSRCLPRSWYHASVDPQRNVNP